MPLRRISLLLAGVLLAQSGCAARFGHLGKWLTGSTPPAPQAPAPAPEVRVVDPDSTELPWARNEDYFIVVSRACKQLNVFYRGHLVRRFPVVFGMNSHGSKRYEGDRRTPTGFYSIVEKRPHSRWARFMLLDYPNTSDLERYTTAMTHGTLPLNDEEAPGIGGAIGIHGSDKEELNSRGVDWTFGCISLTNDAVLELDSLVPVGTPVLIGE